MAFDIYGRTIPDYFGTKQQGYDFDEQPQGYAGTPGARSMRGPNWYADTLPQGGLTYAQPVRTPSAASVASPAVRRAAPTADYLGATSPTRQTAKDLTDEDRAAMQERYYQFQLQNGDPLAQRRYDQIGQQELASTMASKYATSPQGQAIAARNRLNSGESGPTATMANNPVPRDASFDTGDAYATYRASQAAQRAGSQSNSRMSTHADPYGLNRAY